MTELADYFGYKLRLVGVVGETRSLQAERLIRVKEPSQLSPALFAPLRADLVAVTKGTQVTRDLLKKIEKVTHEAGCVYFESLTKQAERDLTALNFKETAVRGLFRKQAGNTPDEYGVPYIKRWGDLDFTKNWRLESQQILAHMPSGMSKKSLRVLDVGCLNGYIMEALHRAGVKQVFGTDISYEIAINRCVNPYHLPAITVGDFANNRYPGGFSDMTICMEVLEHIPPEATNRFIAELARVTSPHGVILISTSEDWEVDETHSNCRNRAEWYYQFSRHGLIPSGSQEIFPGFNSFVLTQTSNPITRTTWQTICWLRLMLTGRLKPREADNVRP
jgi:2-polyprenyl-3-methyl-5-hydroxy-6-metoxy-1,4-benzoquinol methylase